jgi:hypothetical protein
VGRTDGQPIEGALVRVFDSLDREIGVVSSVLFPSDGQGRFGTFGLQSGTYRVVVQVNSGANAGSYVLGGPTCVSAVVPCVPPTGGETFTLDSRERRDLGVIALGDRLFASGFEP